MSPEVAEHLSAWQARLNTISQNLMELSETEMSLRISVQLKDSVNGYTGATAREAAAAFQKIDDLWVDYLQLKRLVDEAAAVAARGGLFHRSDERVVALLDGDSIELPAVRVPLPQRSLLTSTNSPQRTTAAKVLEAMQQEFARARDTLSRIDAAETALTDRTARLAQRQAALAQKAQTLGAEASRVALLASLAEARRDPLGNALDLQRAETELAAAEAQLESLEQERDRICTALVDARRTWIEAREMLAGARAAAEETRLKIAPPHRLEEPPADDALASLGDWLVKLEAATAQGRWNAAAIGYERWRKEFDEQARWVRACYSANRQPLDERTELRGRFSAYSAKLAAWEQRGFRPDSDFQQLRAQTAQALQARPFEAAPARRLLAEFEKRLAAAV